MLKKAIKVTDGALTGENVKTPKTLNELVKNDGNAATMPTARRGFSRGRGKVGKPRVNSWSMDEERGPVRRLQATRLRPSEQDQGPTSLSHTIKLAQPSPFHGR